MVEKDIYLTISRFSLLIVGGLVFATLILLIISVLKHLLVILKEKLTHQEKLKYLDYFYSYILDQIELDELKKRITNKNLATEALTTAISQIKGSKWEKLKQASHELSITTELEASTNRLAASRRIHACHLLGLLVTERSVEVLIKRLHDRRAEVVSASIIAIGEIGNLEGLKYLLKIYKAASATHAWLIASVISRFPTRDIYSEIEKLLSGGTLPPDKAILLIKVLASFHLDESLNLLINLYKNSPNIDVRIAALSALGKINDLTSVKLIFEALHNERWEIRAIACNLIGEMGLKGASYRLLPLLQDKNWWVRRNAAYALVNLGKIGIHTLLNFLETSDRYARDIIAHALEESGIIEDSVMIITGNKSGDTQEAREILKALAAKGYTKFMENFTSYPEIRKILKGATAT
ncbi:MAG: hypothetical protein DRP54_09260 [Spirochaetes bacterium]|nr:MAG: hypothetical protein DRP54_09260 [Spirochaetota bacterium]